MKIISFKICPFVQRVTALLEAKNKPYEIEYIQLNRKPQWFLDVSPNGQVPVLITDDGQALFESDALVEYLEEIYPVLQPHLSPEQRAINRAWSYLATKHYLTQCSAQRSPDKETLLVRREKLNKAFSILEEHFDGGPFFNGKTLSMVDIAWLPLLHRASLIKKHSGYNFLENFSKLEIWQVNLIKTGLAARSVAPDFEEAFCNFYLSEKTYLGGLARALHKK